MTVKTVDRKLQKARRSLLEAYAIILEAAELNRSLPRSEQYGGMELARAADFAADSGRMIGYAATRNGYGQPR